MGWKLRYRVVRGYRPWAGGTDGSLDEVGAVVLENRWDLTSATRTASERLRWNVSPEIAGMEPICVVSTTDEESARAQLARYSVLLDREPVDRTAPVQSPEAATEAARRSSCAAAAALSRSIAT